MDGKWRKRGALAFMAAILVGCRTPQPDLKPAKQPEVLHSPPQEARFNDPSMPKEAFNRDNPNKRWRDLTADNAVMPAKGSFGGPRPGMMQ